MFKKKTTYESIYEWINSNKGTCFYCKEDKPIDIKIIGEKGICKECADNFEIGHVGADRHAIDHLSPSFKNAKEAATWLTEKGATLIFRYKEGGIHFYDAINDKKVYLRHRDRMAKATGPIITDDAVEEELFSYNSVQISDEGHVHIIY